MTNQSYVRDVSAAAGAGGAVESSGRARRQASAQRLQEQLQLLQSQQQALLLQLAQAMTGDGNAVAQMPAAQATHVTRAMAGAAGAQGSGVWGGAGH